MENVLEIEHLSLSLPSKKGMIPILHALVNVFWTQNLKN